ncbi:MAG TPA: hypothetical protein VMZ29_16420 [Candidatus Bathyarchaeia archaeon]|nr:hypothetical protein [Candidatus Bathyarchaeia archaeon]
MKKQKILRWSHFAIILCIFLFIVFIGLSMFFYAGGTWIDYNSQRYSFSNNLFSDLSRRTTFLGTSNIISSALFSTAMIVIGIAGIIFFLVLLPNFYEQKITRRFSLAGSIFGILDSLIIASLAFVPIDKYEGTHLILIIVLFSLLIMSTALYSIVIIYQPSYPNFFGWVFLSFMIILVSFFILINYQFFEVFLEHLTMRAICQEVVIGCGLINFLIQTSGLLKNNPYKSVK